MNTEQMLIEIRSLIAKCRAPEREVYEALCSEADGWEMRLQELDEAEE